MDLKKIIGSIKNKLENKKSEEPVITGQRSPEIEDFAEKMRQDREEEAQKALEQTAKEQQNKMSIKVSEIEKESPGGGQYLVVKGAICACDKGANKKVNVPMHTHSKYYVNEKLVVTIEDVEGLNFVSCSAGDPKSCTYKNIGPWEIEKNEGHPVVDGIPVLIESGKLKCERGGTIKIITHGQQTSVSDDSEVSVDAVTSVNSFITFDEEEGIVPQSEDKPKVKDIKCLTTGDKKGFVARAGMQLVFEAELISGNKKNVNWGVRKKNAEWICYNKYGHKIPLIFKEGSYQILARGGSVIKPDSNIASTDRGRCLDIKIVKSNTITGFVVNGNFVNTETPTINLLKGKKYTITPKTLLEPTELELKFTKIRVFNGDDENRTVIHLQNTLQSFDIPTENEAEFYIEAQISTPTPVVLKALVIENDFKDIKVIPSVLKIRHGATRTFSAELKTNKIDPERIFWEVSDNEGVIPIGGHTGQNFTYTFPNDIVPSKKYKINAYYKNLFLKQKFSKEVTAIRNTLKTIDDERGLTLNKKGIVNKEFTLKVDSEISYNILFDGNIKWKVYYNQPDSAATTHIPIELAKAKRGELVKEENIPNLQTFKPDKEGCYTVIAELNESEIAAQICVSLSKVVAWQFVDDNEWVFTQLGYRQPFNIDFAVDGWGNEKVALSLLVEYSFSDYKQVELGEFTLDESGRLGKTTIDSKHPFWTEIDEITNGFFGGYSIKDVSLVVSGDFYPFEEQSQKTEKLALYLPQLKKTGVRPTVKMCKNITYEGRFADAGGVKLNKIIRYEDPCKAQIRILKGYDEKEKEPEDKYLFTLYENQPWGDSKVNGYKKKEVTFDREKGIIDVEITTSELGQDTHEKDKKTAFNPRLFYFLLEEKRKLVDTDLFFYPERRFLNDDVLVDLEAHEEGKEEENKAKDDKNLKKIKKNGVEYFNSLKVAKETTLNSTLENMSMSIIGEALPNKGRKVIASGPCTRCKEDLTLSQLQKIVDISGTYICRTSSILPFLNKYMKAFKINENCRRRAHFLAQLAKETKFYSFFEDFTYDRTTLKAANFPNRPVIHQEVLTSETKKASTEAEYIKIANIGYGRENNGLGNNVVEKAKWGDKDQDGYKYRGRGMIQLTGRTNYTNFQKWYNKEETKEKIGEDWEDISFVDDPDLLSTKEGNNISKPKFMVLSAIFFWDSNNMNALADKGEGSDETKEISKLVNPNQPEDSFAERHSYFQRAHMELKDYQKCGLVAPNRAPEDELDIITYHIYHDRTIKKHIPKTNKYPDQRKYIYHDQQNTEYNLGIYECIEVDETFTNKDNDKLSEIPDGYDTSKTWLHSMVSSVDASKSYYYYNEDGELESIVVQSKAIKGGAIRKYHVDKGKKVKLINMRDIQVRNSEDEIVAGYSFMGTERYYCGEDQYASFIGMLFEFGKPWLGSGNTHKDGTGFPSLTHVNGYSFDFHYSRQVPGSDDCDQTLINVMHDWNYKPIYIGSSYPETNKDHASRMGGHDTHIHCGPNKNVDLEIINEE